MRRWGHDGGARLFRRAVGDAASYLCVLEGNTRAIRFYERQGYREDAIIEEVPEGGTCGWCDSPKRTECCGAAAGVAAHAVGVHRINRSLGGLIARSLAGSDFRLDLRLLVRDPERSPDIICDCDVRVCEYADEEAAVAALRGIDTLFMVSASEAEDRREQHRTFIRAAGQAGVRHLVYTSFSSSAGFQNSPRAGPPRRGGRDPGERRADLDVPARQLLPRHPAAVRRRERRHPWRGRGRVAAVARADIAEVAVEVLRDPAAHADATYTLTGPEVTLHEVASRAGPFSAGNSGSRTSRSRRRTPPGGRRTAPQTGS